MKSPTLLRQIAWNSLEKYRFFYKDKEGHKKSKIFGKNAYLLLLKKKKIQREKVSPCVIWYRLSDNKIVDQELCS